MALAELKNLIDYVRLLADHLGSSPNAEYTAQQLVPLVRDLIYKFETVPSPSNNTLRVSDGSFTCELLSSPNSKLLYVS